MRERLTKLLKKNKDKKAILFIDQLFFRFKDDSISSTGSQLAYYLVLSIFPFLIVLLNMVQFTPLASGDILDSLVILLPIDTQDMIKEIVNGTINASSGTLLSVSVVGGLWTSSSGIKHLIKAINKSYDYKEKRNFIKLRLLAMLFTLILSLVIVLVFSSLIFGELIGKKLFTIINISSVFSTVWSVFRIAISLLSMIVTFTLLYKWAPSFPKGSRTSFRNALPGAIFVTIGWAISSTLFSFYVNNFGRYSITYGSLGGIIVFLIWLYISSIIIVLGGEVNATVDYFNMNEWNYDKNKSIMVKFILDDK